MHFLYLFFIVFADKPDPNSCQSALFVPFIFNPAVGIFVQQPAQPFKIGPPFCVHVHANAVFAAFNDADMLVVNAFTVFIIFFVLYFICNKFIQLFS